MMPVAGWAGGVAADLSVRIGMARGAIPSPSELDPTGEQARTWVGDELAKDEYHDTRSLFERLMRWLSEKISDLMDNQSSGGVSLPPLVIAAVVVVLIVGVGYLLTTIRGEQKTLTDRQSVLGDPLLTAGQLRERGEAAMAEGRWGDAVLDFTRAIARDADNRTLLTDAPSLTAHEIGSQLAVVFPGHVAAVDASMDLFDAVAYGARDASRGDAESVRTTDHTLRRARPEVPKTPRRPTGPRAGATPLESTTESLWTTGTRA